MSSTDKYLKKWSNLIENIERRTELTTDEESEWFKNIPVSTITTTNTFNSVVFPMVRRIAAATLGAGGTTKSKKQQQKEDLERKEFERLKAKFGS